MSDKELDQLFQSKLEDFEEMPSADLWAKIDKRVEKKSKSGNYQWVYRIAACLLVGLAVWLLLPAKKPVTQIAKKQEPVERQLKPVEDNLLIEKSIKEEQLAQAKRPTYKKPVVEQVKAKPSLSARTEIADQVEEAAIEKAPEIRSNHVELPDLVLAAAIKTDGHFAELNVQDVKPLTITNSADNEDGISEKRQARVKSLGGLINLVIAKVDKREDKIIEFDESDEDESNLTALNLGILKIKRNK